MRPNIVVLVTGIFHFVFDPKTMLMGQVVLYLRLFYFLR